MTDERFNRLVWLTRTCPRGCGTFCDGTPNLSQEKNAQTKRCRFFVDGKCQRRQDEKQTK